MEVPGTTLVISPLVDVILVISPEPAVISPIIPVVVTGMEIGC